MRIESLAHFPLAQLPTPIEELKSLSRELGGPALLIKRDDQTGLALGGNKTRKLETFRADETVFFWHTGGAPALFAYAKDLICSHCGKHDGDLTK